MELTEKANVVIACRVSPKQKAELVNIVREAKESEGITTLAIGDGANDVNMITAAHIGIGISGLEGQQAARSADYSVGQFRFLKNLMFAHGREAYRRNSYLVNYFFYKNLVYVTPVLYYGIFTKFSGTLFYDTFFYQFFNVSFTGLPVAWYSMFDWAYTKETLLSDPTLYSLGLKRRSFNAYVFSRWLLNAIWQSIFIMIICFNCLEERAGYDSKHNHFVAGSLIDNGTIIMQVMVLLVNLKIITSTSTHTCWSVFFQLGSVLSFYAMFSVLSLPQLKNYDDELIGSFQVLMSVPTTYLLIAMMAVGFVFIDLGQEFLDK